MCLSLCGHSIHWMSCQLVNPMLTLGSQHPGLWSCISESLKQNKTEAFCLHLVNFQVYLYFYSTSGYNKAHSDSCCAVLILTEIHRDQVYCNVYLATLKSEHCSCSHYFGNASVIALLSLPEMEAFSVKLRFLARCHLGGTKEAAKKLKG